MTCSWFRPSPPSTQVSTIRFVAPGARRRAVRDVDARCVGEVVSRARDAVHLEAPLHRIEDAGVDDLEEPIRGAERRAAVGRGGHVDAVLLELLVPAEPEHVDGAVAGGADRAAARPTQARRTVPTAEPGSPRPGPSTRCRRRSLTSRPGGRARPSRRWGLRGSSRSRRTRCRSAGSRRRCRPRSAPCPRTRRRCRCRGSRTGAFHALLSPSPCPVAAAVASSVRDTPIPSTPLNAKSLRLAAKFEVRFA